MQLGIYKANMRGTLPQSNTEPVQMISRLLALAPQEDPASFIKRLFCSNWAIIYWVSHRKTTNFCTWQILSHSLVTIELLCLHQNVWKRLLQNVCKWSSGCHTAIPIITTSSHVYLVWCNDSIQTNHAKAYNSTNGRAKSTTKSTLSTEWCITQCTAINRKINKNRETVDHAERNVKRLRSFLYNSCLNEER